MGTAGPGCPSSKARLASNDAGETWTLRKTWKSGASAPRQRTGTFWASAPAVALLANTAIDMISNSSREAVACESRERKSRVKVERRHESCSDSTLHRRPQFKTKNVTTVGESSLREPNLRLRRLSESAIDKLIEPSRCRSDFLTRNDCEPLKAVSATNPTSLIVRSDLQGVWFGEKEASIKSHRKSSTW